MSILITGVSGHIGKVILNKIYKSKKNFSLIYNKNKIEIKKKNIVCIKKNIFDKKKFNNKKVNSNKTLLHLAWEGLNLRDYNSAIHLKQVNSHLNFIEDLLKSGTKNIVIVGTCFEYGDYEGELVENLETKPITKYGKAKDILRKKIEKLKLKYEFNFTWLRLFYFYGGPNYKKDLWGTFNLALRNKEKFFEINNGNILRDYMHINDVAKIIWYITMLNKDLGIVNICSNKVTSVKNLVKGWVKESKFKIKIKFREANVAQHEKKNYWGSNKKLKLIYK